MSVGGQWKGEPSSPQAQDAPNPRPVLQGGALGTCEDLCA